MACRRGKIVRRPSWDPYGSSSASSTSARPHRMCFADIAVEVILDCPHPVPGCLWQQRLQPGVGQDASLPPPCWLISESQDAYAFTVQRPGSTGLKIEDVEVQIDQVGDSMDEMDDYESDGREAARDESCCESSRMRAGRCWGSDTNGDCSCRSQSTSHQQPRGTSSSSHPHQQANLLLIFCERLFGGAWSQCFSLDGDHGSRRASSHPVPCRGDSDSSSSSSSSSCSGDWERVPGQRWSTASTSSSSSGSPPPASQPGWCGLENSPCRIKTQVSRSQGQLPADSCYCVRSALGIPWKFGRSFSLPEDAVADKAVAAHSNGTLTVIVPRFYSPFGSFAFSACQFRPSEPGGQRASCTPNADHSSPQCANPELKSSRWVVKIKPMSPSATGPRADDASPNQPCSSAPGRDEAHVSVSCSPSPFSHPAPTHVQPPHAYPPLHAPFSSWGCLVSHADPGLGSAPNSHNQFDDNTVEDMELCS